MYKVGRSKVDITKMEKGIGLLGYGRIWNVMKGISTRIHARALVIEENDKKIAFVNCEVGFITPYLKHGVLELLKQKKGHGFNGTNIMLTAQHTHSAGGGYGQHFFFNVPVPGFQEDIWETYRQGIVKAILEADDNKEEVVLKYATGDFPEDQEVAFNRSLEAYNENEEISHKLPKDQWHLACDRTMKLMRFEKTDGTIQATLNWFGTHCTSISNDNTLISSDNKGYAATYLEKEQGGDNVAIFAQEACGDVTPNYIWERRKQWTRGKFKDDFESAKYVGELQFVKAKELSEKAANQQEHSSGLEYVHTFFDFHLAEADPKFTQGRTGCKSGYPCWGVSFMEGTKEGPGAPKFLADILKRLSRWHSVRERRGARKLPEREQWGIQEKYNIQFPKQIAVDALQGNILGWDDLSKIPIPGIFDQTFEYMSIAEKSGMARVTPWIPTILPLQIIKLGSQAIVGIPAEVTTVAGRRLRKSLLEKLSSIGIDTIILSPYANGYAGYVTTPEEYMLQKYEAGHTLFGRWTLPVLQTALDRLCDRMIENQGSDLSLKPLIFPREKIWVHPPEKPKKRKKKKKDQELYVM